jgi:hypothetical protein
MLFYNLSTLNVAHSIDQHLKRCPPEHYYEYEMSTKGCDPSPALEYLTCCLKNIIVPTRGIKIPPPATPEPMICIERDEFEVRLSQIANQTIREYGSLLESEINA